MWIFERTQCLYTLYCYALHMLVSNLTSVMFIRLSFVLLHVAYLHIVYLVQWLDYSVAVHCENVACLS